MKYFILLLSIFLFQGCLYFNDHGVSGHLYDNCHSYYDGNGNFIEKCDQNIIDYDEAKEGIVAIKNEISVKKSTSSINIEDLSKDEQNDLIKEDIELIKSHCK
jgi:hypothetical protein